MQDYDVIIIGAGAAGLMCASEAGQRQRRVLVLEHANKPGKKILMSGGGRCNFTNYHISPEKFLSHNPHFCKSALRRYTQWDFIDLVKHYQIPYHEKTAGQLFCDDKASAIVNMLLDLGTQAGITLHLNASVQAIEQAGSAHFILQTTLGKLRCESLVIATGGLSIPTLGASPFGYKVAEQFGIKVWPTRAGLVPLTLHTEDKNKLAALAGVAVESSVSVEQQSFRENMLFTHRGLSGPAVLQISSYWEPGEKLVINLLPEQDVLLALKTAQQGSAQHLKTLLASWLPKRLVETLFAADLLEKKLQDLSHQRFMEIAKQLQAWHIMPNSTEGYRTAEVTLGGVDCDAISSKTMAVNKIPNLFFIGEVLDVSGWLGGYNFQWAWSSGWAAGQVV
jgi:predicted Rossmann fold flavoprotein